MAYNPETKEEYDEFWNVYLQEEKSIYEDILANKTDVIDSTVKELAEKYSIPSVKVMGFLDGINSSLKSEVELNELSEDSAVSLEIDFEKLYFNMLEAKAPWLYEIEAWDGILSAEKREEITRSYKDSKTVRVEKVGRNDPCPCGSGKKYKKCCGK